MASYLCSLTLLLSFLVMSASAFDPPFPSPSPYYVTNDDITTICSDTQDPSFCWRAIKSNPEATRTSLQGVAAYTIDAALADANESYNTVGLNLKVATDKLKTGYIKCSQRYFSAIEYLKSAKRLLAEGDYHAVGIQSLSAAEEANACEHELASILVGEPPSLRLQNKNLKRYGRVIWAISKHLVQVSGGDTNIAMVLDSRGTTVTTMAVLSILMAIVVVA